MKKNYKDDFEDLYLRHDYLRRAGQLDGKHYEEFKHIIEITANIMFKKHTKVFTRIGFSVEDVISIAAVYVMIYMQLYSLRNDPTRLSKYKKSFEKSNGRPATAEDIATSERNYMINFLRQKLSHCSTVCRRKATNVAAYKQKEYYFAVTKDSVDKNHAKPFENYHDFDYKKLGYRKVTAKEYAEAQERAKKNGEVNLADKDGFAIFTVTQEDKGIVYMDGEFFAEFIDKIPDDKIPSPEKYFLQQEDAQELQQYRATFTNMNRQTKVEVLKAFIDKNKEKPNLQQQVALARKMLREDNFVV